MRHPARGPIEAMGIDGKSSAVRRRGQAIAVCEILTEAAA
jgi:hypothetical protein